jgi:type VI secretion system protein
MYGIRQWSSRYFRILFQGICISLLLGTVGCGTGSRSLFGGDVAVRLDADPKINQNSPVPVELVVVYDKDLLAKLAGMTAREWFQNREQIHKDHPGDDELVAMSWEIVPGQSLPPQTLSFSSGARGGLVFADYFADGAHRARVDPHQDIKIHLQADDVAVEQAP